MRCPRGRAEDGGERRDERRPGQATRDSPAALSARVRVPCCCRAPVAPAKPRITGSSTRRATFARAVPPRSHAGRGESSVKQRRAARPRAAANVASSRGPTSRARGAGRRTSARRCRRPRAPAERQPPLDEVVRGSVARRSRRRLAHRRVRRYRGGATCARHVQRRQQRVGGLEHRRLCRPGGRVVAERQPFQQRQQVHQRAVDPCRSCRARAPRRPDSSSAASSSCRSRTRRAARGTRTPTTTTARSPRRAATGASQNRAGGEELDHEVAVGHRVEASSR